MSLPTTEQVKTSLENGTLLEDYPLPDYETKGNGVPYDLRLIPQIMEALEELDPHQSS